MDPLGRILSVSFGHVTNHPKTWWFKTITSSVAFDSVDGKFGLGSAAALRGSQASAGIPPAAVVSCGLAN